MYYDWPVYMSINFVMDVSNLLCNLNLRFEVVMCMISQVTQCMVARSFTLQACYLNKTVTVAIKF